MTDPEDTTTGDLWRQEMNVFEIGVHPAADIFPMLSEDELAELANDISENGLRDPIVVQETEQGPLLIDGRNRRAACQLVKIEPEVRWLNGEDAKAFIWSTNGTRRHMTKGVKAMAYAQLYPNPEKGGRSKKGAKNLQGLPNHTYLTQARAILPHEDLVASVMSGSQSLNDAHKEAARRKLVLENGDEAMTKLRTQAADLADQVDEGSLTLAEALAAFEARQKAEKANRYAFAKCLETFLSKAEVLSSQLRLTAERHAGHGEEIEENLGMPLERAAQQAMAIDVNAIAHMIEEIRSTK